MEGMKGAEQRIPRFAELDAAIKAEDVSTTRKRSPRKRRPRKRQPSDGQSEHTALAQGKEFARRFADVKDAQAQMRHSRVSTTLDVYMQFVPESQRKAVDRLFSLAVPPRVN
jgi:hypothetical protein